MLLLLLVVSLWWFCGDRESEALFLILLKQHTWEWLVAQSHDTLSCSNPFVQKESDKQREGDNERTWFNSENVTGLCDVLLLYGLVNEASTMCRVYPRCCCCCCWWGRSRGDDGDSFIFFLRRQKSNQVFKEKILQIERVGNSIIKKGAWLKCKNMAEWSTSKDDPLWISNKRFPFILPLIGCFKPVFSVDRNRISVMSWWLIDSLGLIFL